MIYYIGKFIFYYITFFIHKMQLCLNRIYPKVIIYRLRDKKISNVTLWWYFGLLYCKKKDLFHIKLFKDDMTYNLFTKGRILTNTKDKDYYPKKNLYVCDGDNYVYFNNDILDDNYAMINEECIIRKLSDIMKLLSINFTVFTINDIIYNDIYIDKLYEE